MPKDGKDFKKSNHIQHKKGRMYENIENIHSIKVIPEKSSSDTAPDTLFSQLEDNSVPGIVMVVFSSSYLGDSGIGKMGDKIADKSDIRHGEELLLAFVNALSDPLSMPDVIAFYHKGVKLLSKDNPVSAVFQTLSEWGVQIFASEESCGKYDVEVSVAGVQIVSMQTICREMLCADKVIHP